MAKLLMGTLLLVVGLVGARVSATPTSKCAYNNRRLPKHIVPEHYDLELDVDSQKFEYKGKVTINLKVESNEDKEVPNDIIVMNVHRDVEISEVTYIDMGAGMPSEEFGIEYISVDRICRDEENDLLVIKLSGNLENQVEGELIISFSGRFRDDKTGIYKTKYKSRAGVDSYLISTDFKPNKARRAFPCFDEPSFKATFDITLKHDQAKVVLSNTNLISTNPDAGLYKSKFERTPPMSTYLLAFAIGEFDHIKKKIANGDLTIRAYTLADKSKQAQFALDTAVIAIEHMEEYFATPFPLKKLDMLSGVELNSNAKENWGLIIFKDSLSLFDEETTSPLSKAHIARTVVHQLTLQWFGNLVTMNLWDDLWLTEGFAGFMEINVTNHLYPKLQVELHHLTEGHQIALNFDSQDDVRPIIVDKVGGNIEENLDEMVYHKSVEIIRLLHDAYLGPEQFKLGIRQHIYQRRHGITYANDLWEHLKAVSGLPVDEFIKSWTKQSGHPLVEARMVTNSQRRLILRQKRERSSSLPIENKQGRGIWIIPVTIRLAGDRGLEHVLTHYMDKPVTEVILPNWFKFHHRKDHWLKINDDSRGFYRVDYGATKSLMRLESPCKERMLSVNNRIGLIADAGALSRDRLAYPTFLEVLSWYKGQTVGSVLGQVARSYPLLPFTPTSAQFGVELFAPTYHKFGLQNELFQYSRTPNSLGVMDIDGLIRAYYILIEINYGPFVDAILDKFNTERNAIALRIRELAYKTVALYGSPNQVEILVTSLNSNDIDEEEKNRIHSALMSASQVAQKWLAARRQS